MHHTEVDWALHAPKTALEIQGETATQVNVLPISN